MVCYIGEYTYPETDLQKIQRDYTIKGEYPIIGRYYPESHSTAETEKIDDTKTEDDNMTPVQRDTPSLKVMKITLTSITYNAIFPS